MNALSIAKHEALKARALVAVLDGKIRELRILGEQHGKQTCQEVTNCHVAVALKVLGGEMYGHSERHSRGSVRPLPTPHPHGQQVSLPRLQWPCPRGSGPQPPSLCRGRATLKEHET